MVKAVTQQMKLQWDAIMKRCTHHSDHVKALLNGRDGGLCKGRLEGISTLHFGSMHAVETLKEWARLADRQAKERAAENANAAEKKWWRWVNDQLRQGAGALHSFSKRDEKLHSAPNPVSSSIGPTLGYRH